MSVNRFTELNKIVNELHEEFKNNGYEVTEKMIADLWLVFGQDNVTDAEKSYKEFLSQMNLIHAKIVGGVKDAFLDFLKTKDRVVSLRLDIEKSGKAKSLPIDWEPLVSVREIIKEYNIPEQTIYKWLKGERVQRVNQSNPARFYRRDVESMLISKGALKKVSERTNSIEKNFYVDMNSITKKLNE